MAFSKSVYLAIVLMIALHGHVLGQTELSAAQVECFSAEKRGCSGTPDLETSGSDPRECCRHDGDWYRLGPSGECVRCIGSAQVRCFTTPSSAGELNCRTGTDPEFNATSIEECCLSPTGQFFEDPTGSGGCTPCIVFGWLNGTDITLEERTSTYTLPAGFIKGGAVQSFVTSQHFARFQIAIEEGNARQGVNLDFIVTDTTHSLYGLDPAPFNVPVTIRVDGIALEPAEEFTLSLVPTNPAAMEILTGRIPGLIAIPEISVVIRDLENVSLQFTEIDYSRGESERFIRPQLHLSIAIATNLVVEVIPLNLTYARDHMLLPKSLDPALTDPNFDPNTQTATSSDDFSIMPVQVTFNSGDSLAPIQFDMEITDDTIHEADQFFLLTLEVISAVDRNRVVPQRTDGLTALGRIIDDDTITIGFEQLQYTVFEEFNATGELILIPVIKGNSRQSELQFDVVAQFIDGLAQRETGDYSAVGPRVTNPFPADEQVIQVQFLLINDRIPEDVEDFSIELTSSGVPRVRIGKVGGPSSRARVFIMDEDELTVGFESTEFEVSESSGEVMLCVNVTEPANELTELEFYLQATMHPGTAGLDDFVLSALDQSLEKFTKTLRRQCFNVTILDDNIAEDSETGTVTLQIAIGKFYPQVQISPASATIRIIDDEYIIGFEHETYTVSEGNESVQVCAGVMSGTLRHLTHIILTTIDGSATNPTDYASTAKSHTLDSIQNVSCMTIPIIVDERPEIHKDFLVKVLLRDSDPHAILKNATIIITDDDVEPEPEKGCTVEVFVLAALREENQMEVVHDIQNVLPGIFSVPLPTIGTNVLPTDSTVTSTTADGSTHGTETGGTEFTTKPTSPTTTAEIPTPSTVRSDPVLSMAYTTLAKEFNKVDSDTGYTQFVEAVTEITEAHQEACNGPLDKRLSPEDVPRLARQFSALSPRESEELRNVFGKMLCLRTRHSTKRRRQIPDEVDPCIDLCDNPEFVMCPDGGFDKVICWCQFFVCLDNYTETRYSTKLSVVFGFAGSDDFPCLAFVVDTTGSMANEIDAVKELILAFTSSEDQEPGCYILTPFNDYGNIPPVPDIDYGPATPYDTMDHVDLENLRNDVRKLEANGGGDGPEYGMHGLQATLRTRWPPPFKDAAVVKGSQVILFTDASAKDANIMMGVIEEADDVCVHLFLSASYLGGFYSYTAVAEQTGGTIVRANHTEFHDLVQIFGDFSRSYKTTPCSDLKSKRKRRSNLEQCQTFKVSVFTSILKLLITTTQSQSVTQKPSGRRVNNTIISGYGSYKELNPESGVWSVCVESGTLSVSFNNRVLLDFVVTIVKEEESSPTHVVATTVPPPACSTGGVAIISSRIPDISLACLNIIKDGDIVASASLTPCSKAMVGNATFPLGSVTYQLQGEDVGGNPFEIAGKTVVMKPGSYSLNTISSLAKLRPGESEILVFELHNQNSYGSTKFTISVETPPDFFVALQQTDVVLEAGESIQISLHVFANSNPGVSNEITLMAFDGCITVSRTHTLTIIPLEFFLEYAGESICSTSTMTTSVTPSACSSGDFVIFIPIPIPKISLTDLSFEQRDRIVAKNPLKPCSASGALVGNATFPLGLVTYQLQGRHIEGKTFTYKTVAVDFKPGRYAFTTISSVTELKPGESTVLVVELYNQNSYGSTEFTISVETALPDFSVALEQTYALLEAEEHTNISIQVLANSVPGISSTITLIANDGCTTVTGTYTMTIIPLDYVIEYAGDDICSTSTMTTSAIPPACSSGNFVVVIPIPVPGISFTHLNFVQHDGRTVTRNPLHLCGDTGDLVGNATFPLGVTNYQLQGKDVNGNMFFYESSSIDFSPGSYAFTAVSTTEELEAGESTVFAFELHNSNLYGSSSYSFTIENERGLSAVSPQDSIILKAGSSVVISVRVSASSSFSLQSKQFTLTANDGCTSVSASRTLLITAPEVPTAAPDLCGCENGGTCVTIVRRRRKLHRCQCPSGYVGTVCQIVPN